VGQDTPIEVSGISLILDFTQRFNNNELEGFYAVLVSVYGIFRGVESFKTLVVKTVKIPSKLTQIDVTTSENTSTPV
jgi:predicted acetyltransferase